MPGKGRATGPTLHKERVLGTWALGQNSGLKTGFRGQMSLETQQAEGLPKICWGERRPPGRPLVQSRMDPTQKDRPLPGFRASKVCPGQSSGTGRTPRGSLSYCFTFQRDTEAQGGV